MTALIVCNGTIKDYSCYGRYFEEASFIIGADGGACHLRRFGIMPHLLLGDFDSISKDDYEYFAGSGTEVIKYPPEKDMTDTELAIEAASQRGFRKIIIIGGLGTRMDHSLSNIFILKSMFDRGLKGIIADERNEIEIIDHTALLKRENGVKVTLLPLTPKVEGVTTEGLYYPLNNATLHMGSTRGVSNEFACETARVTVKKGLMLLIRSKD